MLPSSPRLNLLNPARFNRFNAGCERLGRAIRRTDVRTVSNQDTCLPKLTGTRAQTVVPRLGRESTERFSLHQLQPLLHAVDTKALRPAFPFLRLKAHAEIADRQLNLIRRSPQSSIDLPHTAMLHRIV